MSVIHRNDVSVVRVFFIASPTLNTQPIGTPSMTDRNQVVSSSAVLVDGKTGAWELPSSLHSHFISLSLLTFSSHICDDCDDRCDVLVQEIASYLVLQNDIDNHLFEATQSQNRSGQLTISKRITLKNQFM